MLPPAHAGIGEPFCDDCVNGSDVNFRDFEVGDWGTVGMPPFSDCVISSSTKKAIKNFMKMGTLSEMAGKWVCSKFVRNLDSKFITTIDPPIFYIISYNRGKMNNFVALGVALVYILYRYECGKTR